MQSQQGNDIFREIFGGSNGVIPIALSVSKRFFHARE